MKTSAWSHIYRLIALLLIAVVGFVAVRGLAIPSSWDSDKFFRKDSLDELQLQPMKIGGNESCGGASCHDKSGSLNTKPSLQPSARAATKGSLARTATAPCPLMSAMTKSSPQP